MRVLAAFLEVVANRLEEEIIKSGSALEREQERRLKDNGPMKLMYEPDDFEVVDTEHLACMRDLRYAITLVRGL